MQLRPGQCRICLNWAHPLNPLYFLFNVKGLRVCQECLSGICISPKHQEKSQFHQNQACLAKHVHFYIPGFEEYIYFMFRIVPSYEGEPFSILNFIKFFNSAYSTNEYQAIVLLDQYSLSLLQTNPDQTKIALQNNLTKYTLCSVCQEKLISKQNPGYKLNNSLHSYVCDYCIKKRKAEFEEEVKKDIFFQNFQSEKDHVITVKCKLDSIISFFPVQVEISQTQEVQFTYIFIKEPLLQGGIQSAIEERRNP